MAVEAGAGRALVLAAQTEARVGPHLLEHVDKLVHHAARVEWRGRDAQPLLADRHGRMIDRLHVMAVLSKQLGANPGAHTCGSPTGTGTM